MYKVIWTDPSIYKEIGSFETYEEAKRFADKYEEENSYTEDEWCDIQEEG